jgi:hypothetical protein
MMTKRLSVRAATAALNGAVEQKYLPRADFARFVLPEG